MVFVKPQAEITKNFIDGASRAPAKYKAGVQRADWQTPAASEEAEANYGAGVTEAVAAKSRQKGVLNTSNSEWQNKAATDGAAIIGPRMVSSAGKQASNWQPSRSVIEGMQLPPRTRDAATNVQNRSLPLAVALQEEKKQRKGSA